MIANGKGRTDSSKEFTDSLSPAEFKAFDPTSYGSDFRTYAQSLKLSNDSVMTRPFIQNLVVNACVRKIAASVSSVPMALYDRRGNKVEDSPFLRLMAKPNPLMSRRKFFSAWAHQDSLWGESFWFMFKRSGKKMIPISVGEIPDEIWPVRGDLVMEEIDQESKLPSGWRMGAGEITPAHSVAQIAQYDPYNPLRGTGQMAPAMRTASKDFVIDRYDEALLRNGGSPGGVISYNGMLKQDEIKALERSWHENVENPDRHRRTPVLPLGMTFTPFGFTPHDMEHKDLREWDRQAIMMAFGVTPAILGLTENLNYASAYEARRVFCEFEILPRLEFLADEITCQVLSQMNGPDSEYTARFDIDSVPWLREAYDDQIKRALDIQQRSGRSWGDAARIARLNVEPSEMDDRNFTPQGMSPLPEEAAKAARVAPGASGGEKRFTVPTAPPAQNDDVYIDQYQAALAPHDEKVAKAISRVFTDHVLYVRDRLRKTAKTVGQSERGQKALFTQAELEAIIATNLEHWKAELDGALGSEWEKVFNTGAGALSGYLGVPAVFVNATDPLAIEFLAAKKLQLVEGPFSNLAITVKQKILEVLAKAPQTVASLSQAIEAQLKELESEMRIMLDSIPSRALTIARTENTSIYNAAHVQNMQLAGIERNRWLTADDEHVRPSHQKLNGEVRQVGTVFGYGLRFPGDPQASAAQTVHCRCALVPEIS